MQQDIITCINDQDCVSLPAGNDDKMMDYIRDNVADGLWILGAVHDNSNQLTSVVTDYFDSELNIPLHKVT